MAKRRNLVLSTRHDDLMERMAKKMDVSYTAVVERALEALEEKEAQRDKVVGGKDGH